MKDNYWRSNEILLMLMLVLVVFILCFIGQKNRDNPTVSIINEWIGREIKMPNNYQCNLLGADTAIKVGDKLLKSEYKILLYVDSAGCMTCKLHLSEWNKLIREVEKLSFKTTFLLFFHQKNKKELSLLLKRENFNYPVFIDMSDEINKLNNFSAQTKFQCFLLDKNNNVLLVGNPVKNLKIRDLYLKTILGNEVKPNTSQNIQKTDVFVGNYFVDLRKVDWQKEQEAVFILKNTGTNPLVVDNVSTSCGCTSIEYSQEPVRPGDSVSLHVTYKADYPEHFDKTITVYCNAKSSPVVLRITGDAE